MDDVEQLARVLDLAKERGLVLSAVCVGAIKLAVSGQLPPEQPKSAQTVVEVRSPEQAAQEKKLKELRKRASELGWDKLPDDALLAMEGAL